MKISILGTGAYGLSLAFHLLENGHDIIMWTAFEEEKDAIEKTRYNQKVLKDVKIPEEIKVTTNLEEAILGQDIIVVAVPAHVVNSISKQMMGKIDNQILVIASKGIEQNTCLFLEDVIAKYNPRENICVMAGGSFAIDIIHKMPVGLSIASQNEQAIAIVKKAFENEHFKLRPTKDTVGVQICSAIKNVIAIAAGMLDGMKASESTKAMFITESLHDIMELIFHLGGNPKTILSFSGFGDILLTCTSEKSRNFTFGQTLATKSKEEIEEYKRTHTIEGLYTLESIHQLIQDKQVDIEIIDLIHEIIDGKKEAKELFTFLIEKE